MKKLLLALLFVFALLIISYGLALADNGPHGGFAPATDACAGCHRTHTAPQAKLLLSSSTALCMTCHSSTGTGADTNVTDGVYVNRDATTEDPAQGVAARGLKGGGFTNALMDTNENGVADAASRPATSAHIVDGPPGTAWGNGDIGSGAGPAIALGCGSCHNPHGRAAAGGVATYRILRPRPSDSGAASDVNIADEPAKIYTVADDDNRYYGQNYTTFGDPMSQWCGQCHTRYMSGSKGADTDSGDAIFKYRHPTTAQHIACTSCHVAHGTASLMGPNSGSIPFPNGATTPSGNARSSLLRLDNSGVCFACHDNP